MAYGPNYPDLFRRAAKRSLTKIMRGASPGDIPVEQPTRFYLVINLKSAKALGLTVPNRICSCSPKGDRLSPRLPVLARNRHAGAVTACP